MANTYKDIVITPYRGDANNNPYIRFSSGDASVNADMNVWFYATSNGTLSFEGSAGQLFSITNDLSGTIFSVNDISGIPSLEIDANGKISLAHFGGNVGIGTSNAQYKLDVAGDVRITGNVILGDNSTDTITLHGSFISLGNNQNIDAGTLFIDGTNNEVGIGITNPTSNLHVIGTGNITGALIVQGSNVIASIAAGNSFTSATIAGANTAVGGGANSYAATVGTSANAFTSATVAGANTAVGAGANAYAQVVGAAANSFMITVQNGSNTAVGAGANAFTSATIAGANTAVGTGANAYAAVVGTSANAFTSATIAGANTAVGGGANAYAQVVGAAANSFMITVQNGSNTAVGTGANAFTSATIAGANTAVGTGANAYAAVVGTSANAFASATIAGANTAVGGGANAYAQVVGAAANSFMITVQNGSNTAVGTGANTYAATVGTSANAFTSATIAGANTAVGTGANAFTSATIAGANTAIGTGANAFTSATIAGANSAVGAGANTVGVAAFVKANAALPNTSGISFNGNLNFPNGNVGIGTSSPTSNLHVVGKANIRSELETSLLVESNGRTSISFGRGTDNIGGHLISTSNSQAILAGGAYYNGSSWVATSSNSTYLQFNQGVTTFFSNTGATVGGVPTLIENARIADNGRVGIGNTNPGALLHVGSTAVQYTPRIGTRVNGNAIEFGHTNQAGYGSVLGAEVGSGAPFLAFHCGAGTNINTYKTFGIKGVVIKTDNAGGLLFNTVDIAATTDNQSLTERMRITESGRIGINTTSPSANLDVTGNVNVTGNITTANIITRGIIPTTNNSLGTAGQILASNGTVSYWSSITPGAYKANVGNGTANTYNVNHALSTTDVLITVKEWSTGYIVYPDVQITTPNHLVVSFVDAPTTNQYSIIILGV